MTKKNIFLIYKQNKERRIRSFYNKLGNNLTPKKCEILYKKIFAQIKNDIRVFDIPLNIAFHNKIQKLTYELLKLQNYQFSESSKNTIREGMERRKQIKKAASLLNGMKTLKVLYEKELFFSQQILDVEEKFINITKSEDSRFSSYLIEIKKKKIAFLHNAFSIYDITKSKNIQFLDNEDPNVFYKQFLD